MVIRITVLSGPEAGTSVEGPQRITIGSAAYCNLRLTGKGVLAVHAEINVTAQGLQLRSFSTTGTRVNGQPVTEYHPSPEEEVEFGEGTRVRVIAAEQVAPQPSRPARVASAQADFVRAPRAARVPSNREGSATAFGLNAATIRFIKVSYSVILILGLIFYFVTLEKDVREVYVDTKAKFEAEAIQKGLPAEEVRARWDLVARAYSLERAGHNEQAMTQYLRILADEGRDSPKSAAWTFAAKRMTALRSSGTRRSGASS